MAKFIPIEKMKKLRESAKAGDERAKAILRKQMLGEEDFSGDLEEYFKPVEPQAPQAPQVMETSNEKAAERKIPATKSRLQEFLEYNGITKESPDYQDFVESFYADNPDEPREVEDQEEAHAEEHIEKHGIDMLIDDEIEAIEGYSKVIMEVLAMDELSEATKKGLVTDLEEIKRDEIEHLEKLKRMKNSLNKKEEEQEEQAL